MKPFRKEQVNKKLKPLGWEIPEGINYKGMLENHAVRCVKCGWVQEKRLDNLIYREEQCPCCGNGVFEGTIQSELQKLTEAVNTLKVEVLDSFKMFELMDIISSVGMKKSQDDIQTKDLKALFRKYIAKKGFIMYGRKMMSDEWHKLSHELSEELMIELADSEEQFDSWEAFYIDILSEHPTKQGQDILFVVIPRQLHNQLRDEISKRLVKL